jgi:hypothetical protein
MAPQLQRWLAAVAVVGLADAFVTGGLLLGATLRSKALLQSLAASRYDAACNGADLLVVRDDRTAFGVPMHVPWLTIPARCRRWACCAASRWCPSPSTLSCCAFPADVWRPC